MITNQLALIRRELWEHSSIWVTPAAIVFVLALGAIASFVAASGFGVAVDIAIIGASNVGDAERRVALMVALLLNTSVLLIAMWILTIFYSLDALYTERKDKSILFWRSLPITDTEAVLSKLLTAAILIPLVTFVAVIVSHLINLLLTSIWISFEGGSASHLIWGSVPLFDTWAAILIVMIAAPLWASPIIGWFLFVSAWTKRSPLLMAFLPIIVLALLEYVVFRSHLLFAAIGSRTQLINMPIFNVDPSVFFNDNNFPIHPQDGLSLLAHLDVGKFVTSPGLWAGLAVCGLLVTAAIYVRRYRDDS
ncbi:MAG: ABC-2 transporter permease [Proteobacteria bacterium]|nr:ABC-2 transporter permease [Pseudomonadota bacterium]